MVQAGDIMGIEVLDHLIIGGERFLSMKEANLF
ncbi:MAG: JAB domain-containing protein [Candidatus Latescibacterota bacterium]